MITSLTALVLAQFVIRPEPDDPTVDLGTVFATYGNTQQIELRPGEYWIQELPSTRRTVQINSNVRALGTVVINVCENVRLKLNCDDIIEGNLPNEGVFFRTFPSATNNTLFVEFLNEWGFESAVDTTFTNSCIGRVDGVNATATFFLCRINVVAVLGQNIGIITWRGDLNRDTRVDNADLIKALSNYGSSTDFEDIQWVISQWGVNPCN